MVECPYCGKKYKRLTANHVKTHGITWEEYTKEFKEENYIDMKIVEFLNDFYVTKRSKYLLYNYKAKNPITVYKKDGNMPLHIGILKQHRSHTRTIGIFFPEIGSKMIGLDLDKPDKELLNKIYKKLIEFLPKECILLSYSGNKGFHIDIFLEDIIERDIIKRFYRILLKQLNIDKETLELRGATEQGYKLPFGIHQGTQAYCYACTEFGEEIKDEHIPELLKTRTKADIRQLERVIELEYSVSGLNKENILNQEEIIAFEDIKDSVTPLLNYNNLQKDFVENLSKVYRDGFVGKGIRNKYTLKIALFLKCHLICKKDETLKEMRSWADRCKGYESTKKEFLRDIENTVERVYREDLKLTIAAKEIKISKVEIKEILSIKTKNKLQTKALRKLYYMFLLQSKAYSDVDGVFYFTLEQMQNMGAVKKKETLMEQIRILVELGKVYKYATKRVSRMRYAPTEYKLVALSEVTINNIERTFNICKGKECSNCLECATCFFIKNNKQLKEFYTGRKKYCPYNK